MMSGGETRVKMFYPFTCFLNRKWRHRLQPVLASVLSLTNILFALGVNTLARAEIPLPVGSDTHVTRSEALVIAESYRDLDWTAAAGNISAGTVDAGDGHYIRTPAWVTVGSKLAMPYKWGGFSSVSTFLTKAAANKYTGSDYTSDVSWGDNYCVGIDCSGFVSRCWRTSTKYGTTTLPTISTALSSFDDMLPGDCINLSGSHVRLFVRKEENGTYTFIEAMGTYWRVKEQNYTASAIASYIPRRYDNILEIDSPKLLGLIDSSGTDLTVRWQPVAASDADSIVIYLSTDGDSYNVAKRVRASDDSTIITGLSASTLYYINATFDSRGREGLYSMDYPTRLTAAASSDILIVEDDARYGNHDNARFAGVALSENGYSFDVCNTQAITDGDVALSSYWTVIWFTGRAGTVNDTALNASERAAITSYLQGGGNLLISGQEIAYALDFKAHDEAFLHTYLKADYSADDAGNNVSVVGRTGTILSGLTFELDEDNGLIDDGGAYDARYPDVIKIFGNGDTICSYDVGGVAGVCVSETFSGGSAPGKMIYFAFPFECIKSSSARKDVMGKAIGYFGSPPTDTGPSITVITSHSKTPDEVFSIALTATDDADTAIGLTWSATDTNAALWTTFVFHEGTSDSLELQGAGSEGTDTFTLIVTDSDGMTDTVTVVATLALTAIPDIPTIYYALNNPGDTRVTVRWQHDDKASYYVIFKSPDNSTYDTAATVNAPEVSVMIDSLALNQRYYFKIRAFNGLDSPSSSVSMTLGMRTIVETASYLLVEDDFGWGSHDYIAKHVGALNAANRSFDCCVSTAVTDGAVSLSEYKVVVWTCGNDSPTALSIAERNAIKSYLDAGGRLLLSGNNIGYDLNTQDPDYYERYLKCRFGANDAVRYTLKTVDSGALYGLPDFYIWTDDGGSVAGTAAYQATSPDRSDMVPAESVNGGRATLKYWDSGWTAGVDYTGAYGITEEGGGGYVEAGTAVSKLVLLNFAFECINNIDTRYALMTRLVQYFDSASVAGRVSMDSCVDDSGAIVYLTRSDGSDTRICISDTAGRFRFDFLDSVSYKMRVTANGYLAARGDTFSVGTYSDHFDSFTLIPGDINQDNTINIFDSSMLWNGINHPGGPNAGILDLNHDGAVNDIDMIMIRQRFGRGTE